MKATLPKEEITTAKWYEGKETIKEQTGVVNYKGKIETAIRVAVYMGRSKAASTVYASIWVYTADGRTYSASGSAGGGGYHKESAAIADAIDNAGIKLYGGAGVTYSKPDVPDPADEKKIANIGGAGDHAVRVALESIARASGYRGKLRIV